MTRGLATPILRRGATAAARAIDLGPADVEALDRGEIPASATLLALLADATDGPARAGHLIREVGLMGVESLAPLALGATTIPQRIRAWEAAVGEIDFVAAAKLLRVLERRVGKADRKAEKRAAGKSSAKPARPTRLRLVSSEETVDVRPFAEAIGGVTGLDPETAIRDFGAPLRDVARLASDRGISPRTWAAWVTWACSLPIANRTIGWPLALSGVVREAIAGKAGCTSAVQLAEAIAAQMSDEDEETGEPGAEGGTPWWVFEEASTQQLVLIAREVPAGRVDEFVSCVECEFPDVFHRLPRCYIGDRARRAWSQWQAENESD